MNYYLAYIYNHENSFYELVKADDKDEALDKVRDRYGYGYDVELNEPIQ